MSAASGNLPRRQAASVNFLPPLATFTSVNNCYLLYDWLREGARWSESYVLMGYPSGQDELILPARHFLLWSRKKNVLLAMFDEASVNNANMMFHRKRCFGLVTKIPWKSTTINKSTYLRLSHRFLTKKEKKWRWACSCDDTLLSKGTQETPTRIDTNATTIVWSSIRKRVSWPTVHGRNWTQFCNI